MEAEKPYRGATAGKYPTGLDWRPEHAVGPLRRLPSLVSDVPNWRRPRGSTRCQLSKINEIRSVGYTARYMYPSPNMQRVGNVTRSLACRFPKGKNGLLDSLER